MTPGYGGGEEFVVRLVNALEEHFEIDLIISSQLLKQRLEGNKNRIQLKKGPTFLRYIKTLLALLNLPNHINRTVLLNGQGPAYLTLFIQKRFKKIVLVQHTSLVFSNNKLKRNLVLLLLKIPDKIICVSNYLKDEVNKYLPQKDISVIYNWLPESSIQHFSHDFFSNPLKIIFISRLVADKGILELIEVVASLPNVELTIAGDGPLRRQIEERCREMSCIRILGWKSDLSPYLKEAHINVVNSYSEGFSYTPIEAGVVGIPSLLSDIAVHAEISEQGKHAILFKTGSSKDLSKKIIFVQENRDVLDCMSVSCKRYFTEKFVFSNYKEEYTKALS
jgi:glycosyltransferase involved in cell wall biosynthesis